MTASMYALIAIIGLGVSSLVALAIGWFIHDGGPDGHHIDVEVEDA